MSERTLMRRLRERLGRLHPRVRALAAVLFGLDAALALIHVAALVFLGGPALLRVDVDHSIAEWLQYVQYALVIVLLGIFAVRRREWTLLAWLPLFAYLLADDALLVHERVGYFLSTSGIVGRLGPFDAQAVGELAAPLTVATVMAVALVMAWRAGGPVARGVSLWLIGFIGALAFFGVLVDLLHSLVAHARVLDRIVGFAEDLGEMLVLSGVTVFAAALLAPGRGSAAPASGSVAGDASRRLGG